MGLVYKAYDTVVGREVALKTVVDIQGRSAVEMFYKEWRVLANLHHPNIIEIFDIGEFQDSGVVKPFFVMPLLKGMTLEQILQGCGHQLPAERLHVIVSQVCHGLQAIHDTGLVHRDLKPSNIFVLDFDAVKLIDFGVAHLVNADTATGLKGTAAYISPEQILGRESSPQSDIFALGVLCYEALTGNRPFQGRNTEEVFDAILHKVPQPVNELNPAVTQAVGRVIHKALAKEPRHRYVSAIDLADTLSKALRGEAIPALDPARIQPRIQRAIKSFDQGRYDLAAEILSDLEASGEIDPALVPLRKHIDEAIRRTKVRELLDRAKLGLSEEECPLALQSVEAALKLDPANQEALQIRAAIQAEMARRDIEEWLKQAQEALQLYAFGRVRQLLNKVLELRPGEPVATAALQDLEKREGAYRAARQQKESLFRAAKEAWQNAEFETAAAKLERVLELEAKAPDTASADSGANYASFIELVRSAQAAIENVKTEVPRLIEAGEYKRALELCKEAIAKYPGHPVPQALKLAAECHWRREVLAKIAESGRAADAQPDLRGKLEALQGALRTFPSEPLLERWARPISEQLIVAEGVVSKACAHEEQGQYQEALEQWRMLLAIDPGMRGLQERIDRAAALAGVSSTATESLPSRPEVSTAAFAAVQPAPPVSAPAANTLPQLPVMEPAPAAENSLPAGSTVPVIARPPGRLASARAAVVTAAKSWSESARNLWRWSVSPKGRVFSLPAVAAVLVIAAGLAVTHRNAPVSGKSQPVSHQARLLLSSATPEVTITVGNVVGKPGGNLEAELAPGTYAVEVSREGYETYHGTVSLPAGGLTSTLPEMVPLDSAVHLVADLPNAKIRLDDRPEAGLDQSEFTAEDLRPGDHTVSVSDNRSEARLAFSTAPGRAPELKGPIEAKELVAYAASALGHTLRVAGGAAVPAVSVDGMPGTIGANGIFQFTVANQPHEVVIGADKDKRSFLVGTAHRPSLWVALMSDRNEGSITVSTGLGSFTVLLDDKRYARKIRDGSMIIAGLPAKHYQLRLVADGFEEMPARDVEVQKGRTSIESFTPKPIPQFSTLAVQGLPAHTQILLDNASIVVAEDGTARIGKIPPGDHTIEFRNAPRYKAASIQKNFPANGTVSISEADVTLALNPGMAVLTAVQPGTRFNWTCGETKGSGEAITCNESEITVTAALGGFHDETRTIHLSPGQTVRESFDLSRVVSAPARTAKTCVTADLLQNGWILEQGWYVAGSAANLPCGSLMGRYQFTVSAPTGVFGGKSVSWTLQGGGTPIQFELQKKSFQPRPGAKTDISKFEKAGTVTFQLTIEAGRVVHEVRDGDSWHQVHETRGDFKNARVHFPKDVRIADFSFREQ